MSFSSSSRGLSFFFLFVVDFFLGSSNPHSPSGFNILYFALPAIYSSSKIPCKELTNWFLDPPKLILSNCLKTSPSDNLGLSGSSFFAREYPNFVTEPFNLA